MKGFTYYKKGQNQKHNNHRSTTTIEDYQLRRFGPLTRMSGDRPVKKFGKQKDTKKDQEYLERLVMNMSTKY